MFTTNKNLLISKCFTLLAMLLLMFFTQSASAKGLSIDVELNSNANLYPLSIQQFSAENSGISEPLTPNIKRDLSVAGAFNFVDSSAAKSVVSGSVAPVNNGKYRVKFSLKDVNQKELLAGEFVILPNQARDTSHAIANMIYRALTGFPGIFNSKIAYVRRTGKSYLLQVADVDGGRAITILRSREPIISPAWSPDGNKLAYVSFESGKPVVWIQNLATGKRKQLANFKGSNSAPAWSADGTKLVVTLTFSGNSQIYLINANGGKPKLITNSQFIDTEASFAPDGKSILFVSNRSGGPQIYKTSISDGKVQRLTFQGGYNVSPKVSPDGKDFIYIRKEGPMFRVMLQNFSTGYARPLSASSYNERPSFAPNGQVVLYASELNGKSVLYASSTNGNARTRLGVLDGEIQDPSWGPVSK